MSLCQSCGLCCNGILFTRVSLYPDEIERIRARRLPLVDDSRMRQPCAALEASGDCGIYEERPKRCSLYRCTTLAALEDGKIDAVEARVRVRRIRERIDEIAAHFPEEAGRSVWERAGPWLEGTKGDESGEVVRAIHHVVILLRRHFDDRFDPPPEIQGIY